MLGEDFPHSVAMRQIPLHHVPQELRHILPQRTQDASFLQHRPPEHVRVSRGLASNALLVERAFAVLEIVDRRWK